ncbi:hypothetical protein H2248_007932 [Termitomyces sp. 'cryptogamus']|nr:hypothetical protein H2248_007932 [Termitomyces sp. 'cryptogamus']
MTPDEREIIQALGALLLQDLYGQVVTLLTHGIFCPLGIFAAKNSMKNSSHRLTRCIMFLGILIATCYMVVSTEIVVLYTRLGMIQNTSTPLAVKRALTNKQIIPCKVAVTVLQLIPLLTNDGLMVWRAWVIFSRRQWALWTLIFLWILTLGAIVGTTITMARSNLVANQLLIVSIALTFSTNFITTCFIGYTLWGYWRVITQCNRPVQGLHRRRKVWIVLLLFVETGFIYSLLQLFLMVDEVLSTDFETAIELSMAQNTIDIISIICNMLSMFYPVIVTLLIQGPSLILGILESATSIDEVQVNRIDIET